MRGAPKGEGQDPGENVPIHEEQEKGPEEAVTKETAPQGAPPPHGASAAGAIHLDRSMVTHKPAEREEEIS